MTDLSIYFGKWRQESARYAWLLSAFADGCGLFGFQRAFVPSRSAIQWVLQGIVLS